MLLLKGSELGYAESALQTFVKQKSSEECAFFTSVFQPKLIANLKAKKSAFVISLRGETSSADVVVSGVHGVVPNAFQSSVMKFVKLVLLEPIIASQFKFEKFEVKWDQEQYPNLNLDSESGEEILKAGAGVILKHW